ncbi:hypothetical protein B7494_g818 [Chlorociboria aeruginascens]|nr:hypothetical protein B7494_g818 [Chlorociboria aeruginascens]
MSVRIQLDNPHSFYTNLDYISGRVILSLTHDETISAIVVKLEGESGTILMRPSPRQHPELYTRREQRRDQRQGIAMENHKILYRLSQVFPSSVVNAQRSAGAYTLGASTYEYPFRFKIPINNSCHDPRTQQMVGGGFAGLGLSGLAQMQYIHVKKTLPPSLTGFPGEAEIRYYIKVTVQRPSLFKENRRASTGFKFLPIEPPRPAPTTNEVFARRPYDFQSVQAYRRKSSVFSKKSAPLSDTAPKGEVDARLPSPAILTCNDPLPLRILVRKTRESAEQVLLTSVHAELWGYTDVRAQDVTRTEKSNWPILNLNSLSIPVGKPGDALGTETIVNKELWDRIPLPNTIAPSFETCNLARRYELEIRVGLGYGVREEIQPQTIVLPLNFKVDIYSGIKPPEALLSAMATSHPPVPTRPTAPPMDPAYPPQLGTPAAAQVEDAPPSYEDAMAEDITPADGPRREYSGVTDENAPGLDEKGPSGSAPRYEDISKGG